LGLGYFNSPIGSVEVRSVHGFVVSVRFAEPNSREEENREDVIEQSIAQLKAYFSGERKRFTFPVQLGVTDYQERVLNAVAQIPFGTTSSYLKIARQLGDPNQVRAVGAANGKNPLLIVIPCHRVVGVQGKLTGYSGGVQRKQWLLEHEGIANQLRLFD
jgi:methylated-DNA-[protein]-cysteine S-methyltransferase